MVLLRLDKDCVCRVVQDHATFFFGVYSAESKDSVRTVVGFNLFIGPEDRAKLIYSDTSDDIDAACKKPSLKSNFRR